MKSRRFGSGALSVRRFRLLIAAAVAAVAAVDSAAAADQLVLPTKAPPKPPAYDWAGLYVGGHFGYAGGTSRWSATDSGGGIPTLAGSLDLYNSFNAFKGDGSYFAGLQAGYNFLLPSRVLLGIEADVSAPSTPLGITGSQDFSSPAAGLANYSDRVLQTGTLRGRFGYRFDNWLLYATGGFAWSYDRLVRTQIAGTAVGGGAAPGDDESLFLWRLGWAAGAGIEFPLAPNWSAKAEYLFSDFGRGSATFFTGAQRFDSDLSLHSVRVGLNYHINGDAAKSFLTQGPSALETDRFNFHAQTTFVSQYAFPFHAPYFGQNSLHPNQGRETWDLTFYAGFRLWKGAELWINPKSTRDSALSGTLGVAGFTSGKPTSSATPTCTRAARLHPTDHRSRRRQRQGRGGHQSVRRIADEQPAGDHGRQALGRRHLRQQSLCARCARRFPQLGGHRYRDLRLRGRRLGLHLRSGGGVVPGAWTVRGGVSICRSCRTAPSSNQHSASCSWSARSSIGTRCGAATARSR